MLPKIFQILNTPEIQAFVGSDPVRIFDFGIAPQGTEAPYIAFNQVADSPYDQLSGAACADLSTMQIDIYSKGREEVREMAVIVKSIFDKKLMCNRLVFQTRETDTLLYRICIEVDVIETS